MTPTQPPTLRDLVATYQDLEKTVFQATDQYIQATKQPCHNREKYCAAIVAAYKHLSALMAQQADAAQAVVTRLREEIGLEFEHKSQTIQHTEPGIGRIEVEPVGDSWGIWVTPVAPEPCDPVKPSPRVIEPALPQAA